MNVEADKQINDRITHFHWVSYRHLDLPNFPPSLHFNSAIRCMRKIDEVKAPYDKLKQIVEASKFIYEIIGSREGADLFLPIFVITLIKSNPPNLQSNIELLFYLLLFFIKSLYYFIYLIFFIYLFILFFFLIFLLFNLLFSMRY